MMCHFNRLMYILLKSKDQRNLFMAFTKHILFRSFVLDYMRQCSSPTTRCPHAAYFHY